MILLQSTSSTEFFYMFQNLVSCLLLYFYLQSGCGYVCNAVYVKLFTFVIIISSIGFSKYAVAMSDK